MDIKEIISDANGNLSGLSANQRYAVIAITDNVSVNNQPAAKMSKGTRQVCTVTELVPYPEKPKAVASTSATPASAGKPIQPPAEESISAPTSAPAAEEPAK